MIPSPSPSFLECKICGARASQAQLRDGAHISSVLCRLNKEVKDLRDEYINLENLKARLSAEIKELDYSEQGDNFLPTRDWLKFARRSLKADIKMTSKEVIQLEQIKEALIFYRLTHGLPLVDSERKFTLHLVK